MADASVEGLLKGGESFAERLFKWLANQTTAGISTFVAFLFVLFTIGAYYGYWVTTKGFSLGFILIIAPAFFGILAYKYRNLGLGLFVLMVAMLALGV